MARLMMTPEGQKILVRPVRFQRLQKAEMREALTPPPPPTRLHPIENSSTARARIQPFASGRFFRVTSPPENAPVTPALSKKLSTVLEQLAQANGFTPENPLTVFFWRGTLGLHRFDRAADIYGVGGKGLDQWKREWNAAMQRAMAAPAAEERRRIVAAESVRNLGYKLYKALQAHGEWAQPPGYPVQIFGPWTRREGPHKAISDYLLYLHRDHIHVAK